MSNTLPWRTLATPSTPSARSAPSIALPCGSSTPVFRVTVTRAFISDLSRKGGRRREPPRVRPGSDLPKRRECPAQGRAPRNSQPVRALALDQHRPGALRALALGHDAEALGDLGIGLEQAAEIAAEPVLVELLVRLDVPQAAAIRGDLVGHHDPHRVVFP